MHGTEYAVYRSVSLAHDGDAPVQFERLPLEPPRMERALGREFLVIPPEALSALSERIFADLQFRLRPSLLAELAAVAFDGAAAERDRYVARSLLDNALISGDGVFPLCQDTGTASVYGWKGDRVIVDSQDDDATLLERGALSAWTRHSLRNSQVVPLPALDERNSGDNTPLAAHIASIRGEACHFLFIAKGGGSANKAALYQETKRLLRPDAFAAFIKTAVQRLGVSACPPYRIAIVLGGQSAEESTLAAKLASAGALDALPSEPDGSGGPYRDRQLETIVLDAAAASGWGAQFGGRFLARDARVIRLPRHAASLPVALAVSCSAHRQAYARITADGYFVEHLADRAELERIIDAAKNSAAIPAPLPRTTPPRLQLAMAGEPRAEAAMLALRAGELVALWGPVILARDAAHARLLSMIEAGEALPDWSRYPIFYASPTGTPAGQVVGSIGPTTSRRMDAYLETFMDHGISRLTIGKGERGALCRGVCQAHRGVYLAAVGGAAALAASRYVSSCDIIAWPELGMEAIRLVQLAGLPALVVVDSLGNDYYAPMSQAE